MGHLGICDISLLLTKSNLLRLWNVFLPRQPIEFSNDRLAMYNTFSFSLDNMYIIKRDPSILNLDRERLVISQVREQSASCAS